MFAFTDASEKTLTSARVTYLAKELDTVLNLVDASSVKEMLHCDGLCGVDSTQVDPMLKAI